MSEITEYLSGYLGELDNYMERLNSNRLSGKNRQLFFEVGSEYYDIFQKADGFPEELLRSMEGFNANIINQEDNGKQLAARYHEDIVLHANHYIDTSMQTELQFGIFQKDAEIYRLQNEKMQMLQQLVDLDMKLYGKVSEETQAILEVQNSEILNGRVRELGLWEQESPDSETTAPEKENKTGEEEDASMEKRKALSKDELDQMLDNHFRERQSGRGEKMLDLSNCIISNYVFKGDLETISFDNSELRYCEFRMTKSEHVSMQGAALSDCKLTQAEFNQCNFNNTAINGTVIRSSMFRDCSFDAAYLKQSPIADSMFYRTSFAETRIREGLGSENVFHECGHPEHTVRPEPSSMTGKEFDEYVSKLHGMFSNEGYSYSWELNGVDTENKEADLLIKISYGGELVEEQKYSALLDPDTYAISHIDAGRQNDSLIRMFTPEMDDAIRTVFREKTAEQETQPIRLKFPYMTKDTFMAAKEEIKGMGAKYDPAHKKWYVERGVGQNVINHINNYLSSHDDAVYLRLPACAPKEFRNMIDQLKQEGARYNPDKKLWYITEKEDRSKFVQYLPKEKDSIHEKLSQYKTDAAKQHVSRPTMEEHRKETQERT